MGRVFKISLVINLGLINVFFMRATIEIAQDTGTQAVIRSAHLDLLTPLVSLLGLDLKLHHLTTFIKVIK